jgi:hypothetical protein
VRPAHAQVGRLEDSLAVIRIYREIALASGDVDGWRGGAGIQGDRSDRLGWRAIENWFEGRTAVGGHPDPTCSRSDKNPSWRSGVGGDRANTSAGVEFLDRCAWYRTAEVCQRVLHRLGSDKRP